MILPTLCQHPNSTLDLGIGAVRRLHGPDRSFSNVKGPGLHTRVIYLSSTLVQRSAWGFVTLIFTDKPRTRTAAWASGSWRVTRGPSPCPPTVCYLPSAYHGPGSTDWTTARWQFCGGTHGALVQRVYRVFNSHTGY